MLAYLLHLTPLTAFWALIYFGKDDMQPATAKIFVSIWMIALISIFLFHLPHPVFPAIEAMLSIVLVLIVFGGDMKIR